MPELTGHSKAARLGFWLKTGLGALSAVVVVIGVVNLLTRIVVPLLLFPVALTLTVQSVYLIRFVELTLNGLSFALGVTLSRLLLRLTPPRPSRRLRLDAFLLALILSAWLIVGGWGLATLGPGGSIGLNGISGRAYFALVLGILLPIILHHCFQSKLLSRPFVLVFRRFSSFSDRVVLSEILSSRPSEKRVVLLTPTRSQPGDWNPLQICIGGWRWFSPLTSIPVYVRAEDDDWLRYATLYIQQADRIVLDGSEESDAINAEIDLISKFDRWTDTLVLTTPNCVRDWPDAATVIVYQRSWIRAIPGILVGGISTLLLLMGTGAIGNLVARLSPILGAFALPLVVLLGTLVPSCYLYFFVTFLRPSIDQNSSRLIRSWSREGRSLVHGTAGVSSTPGIMALTGAGLVLAVWLEGLAPFVLANPLRAVFSDLTTILVLLACLGSVGAVVTGRTHRITAYSALLTGVLISVLPLTYAQGFQRPSGAWFSWAIMAIGSALLFAAGELNAQSQRIAVRDGNGPPSGSPIRQVT